MLGSSFVGANHACRSAAVFTSNAPLFREGRCIRPYIQTEEALEVKRAIQCSDSVGTTMPSVGALSAHRTDTRLGSSMRCRCRSCSC